jgi:phage tail-like protein
VNSAAPHLGLTTRFRVEIHGFALGRWSKCEGLSVSFKLADYVPLGHNGHVPILPERVAYEKVTLTRAVTAEDSPLVMNWLSAMARGYPAEWAQITLLDAHDHPVTSWTLRNVYPTKWKGPDLDANSHNVATESLELAHEGFLKE